MYARRFSTVGCGSNVRSGGLEMRKNQFLQENVSTIQSETQQKSNDHGTTIQIYSYDRWESIMKITPLGSLPR